VAPKQPSTRIRPCAVGLRAKIPSNYNYFELYLVNYFIVDIFQIFCMIMALIFKNFKERFSSLGRLASRCMQPFLFSMTKSSFRYKFLSLYAYPVGCWGCGFPLVGSHSHGFLYTNFEICTNFTSEIPIDCV